MTNKANGPRNPLTTPQPESKTTRAIKMLMGASTEEVEGPLHLSLDSLIHTVREVHYAQPSMIQASFRVSLNDNDMTRRIYFAAIDAMQREYQIDVGNATQQAANLILAILEVAMANHSDMEAALVMRLATLDTITSAQRDYYNYGGESLPTEGLNDELDDPREQRVVDESPRIDWEAMAAGAAQDAEEIPGEGRLIEPYVHECTAEDGEVIRQEVGPEMLDSICHHCDCPVVTQAELLAHMYKELLDE